MNGLLRILWTYLYRCQDSASTTTSKLDTLLKQFFPTGRLAVHPADEYTDHLTYIVHFILSRHLEFGKDLCLDLLQESALAPFQQQHATPGPNLGNASNIANAVSSERIAISAHAILLSLSGIERESFTPTWPSSADFTEILPAEDYPTSPDYLPVTLSSRPGMTEFLDRCGSALATIALTCGDTPATLQGSHTIMDMSYLDDQWSYSRLNLAFEEAHSYIIRKHADGPIVAYPNQLVPLVSLLQTCFSTWPRCLHPSISLVDAVNMLLKGMVHLEPVLAEISCAALKRFMTDRVSALTVLSRFSRYLFSASHISQGGSGTKLLVDTPKVLELWVEMVDEWIHSLLKLEPTEIFEYREDILARCGEIEGGGLFLVTSEIRVTRLAGIKTLRLLGLVVDHLSPLDQANEALKLTKILHGKAEVEKSYLSGFDDIMDQPELTRLEQWRQSKKGEIILRLADSSNDKDLRLWPHVFPSFLQVCSDAGATSASFRESMIAAASRYHPTISHLAGLSSRVPAGLSTRTGGVEKDGLRLLKENQVTVDQWRLWINILCSIASLPESHRPALTQLGREHARAPSDASFERERLSSTRGLFRYLTPFLDSEYTRFREIAVLCISSFPSAAYPQLLEDLSLLAGRQFYDDPRSKSSGDSSLGILSPRQLPDDPRFRSSPSITPERTRRQERLHSAVARIYYLTANLLQHQRSAGRQAALANVLKFVRSTQTFLTAPNMRENHTLHRLRRYFCGTVERLFDGLASIKDSDRFIPTHMHLSLYRLCEEWCHLGPQPEYIKQRNARMQVDAVANAPSSERGEAAERFRMESKMLSYAAIGAIAALCVSYRFVQEVLYH
jgi:hypothetical protein